MSSLDQVHNSRLSFCLILWEHEGHSSWFVIFWFLAAFSLNSKNLTKVCEIVLWQQQWWWRRWSHVCEVIMVMQGSTCIICANTASACPLHGQIWNNLKATGNNWKEIVNTSLHLHNDFSVLSFDLSQHTTNMLKCGNSSKQPYAPDASPFLDRQ